MTELPDRYITRKHESHIPCLYGDGRFVVASTFDSDLAASMVRAVLEEEG